MQNDPHNRLFSHHPLFQLAILFASGVVFAALFHITLSHVLLALGFTTIVIVSGVCLNRLRLSGAALLIAMFWAGACLNCLESRTMPYGLRNLIDRQVIAPDHLVELTGRVTGPVELARDGVHLSLDVYVVKTAAASLNCSGIVALTGYFRNNDDEHAYRELDLQSGWRITVKTKLDRTDQYRNPGVSTLAEYLDTKGLDAIAHVSGPASIQVIDSNARSPWTKIYRWRGFLQRQFDSHFSIETAAVLSAALLGNRYNLSPATVDRFREG
ncbi:MAG TPA: DUF4131 domain-containing protein, partial [Pyrinomonadaceae bacterium]